MSRVAQAATLGPRDPGRPSAVACLPVDFVLTDLLDTRRYVETPEGVEVAIDLAGPVVRCWAWLIDFALRGVFYLAGLFLLAITSMLIGEAGMGLMLVLAFFIEWFYPVFFETRYGATPGKMATGLVVLHDDGTPVGWRAALVRGLLRFVDHLPAAPLFGLLAMGLSRDFKRLGDHAAGTVVAYRHRAVVRTELPDVPVLPLPMPLTLPEQRAIIDFARRSSAWTDERRAELGEVLAPVVGGPGLVAARRLQGMARWLLGGR